MLHTRDKWKVIVLKKKKKMLIYGRQELTTSFSIIISRYQFTRKICKVIKKAENYEFRMHFKTSLSIYTIHIPLAKHSRKKEKKKFLFYSSVIKKLTCIPQIFAPGGNLNLGVHEQKPSSLLWCPKSSLKYCLQDKHNLDS